MNEPLKTSQFRTAESFTADDFFSGIEKIAEDQYENVKIPRSVFESLFISSSVFNQMFELKQDENETYYIQAKLDFLGERGITAYATGSLGDIWDNMPVATASTLGGIKVGESLIIEDGVLNINGDTFNLTNYYTKAQTDSLLSGKFDKTGGSITGDVSITGNLTITGLGKEFIADVQTVQIADNLAVINYGETGAGVTAGFSGWEIDRGTATHYRFGYSESPGYFQVGKVGDLQTVATREDVPLSNGFARWNATLKRFDTVVINNIVTGTGTGGQIAVFNGDRSITSSDKFLYSTESNILYNYGRMINSGHYIMTIAPSDSFWGFISRNSDETSDSGIYWNAKNATLRLRDVGNNNRIILNAHTYSYLTYGLSIGKTSVTSGYMLDVNGAIRAEGNIYATGNITAAGEVTAYTASDARLKTNITSLASINALDIINALNPVTYTWNSKAVQLNPNKNTTSINYGIIAQELEQIVPDLIRPIYGDYKTYDDRGLMAIMLQAIKELKSKVDKLENKN